MGRREKGTGQEMGGSGNSKEERNRGMSKGKVTGFGVKSRNGVCPRRELGGDQT